MSDKYSMNILNDQSPYYISYVDKNFQKIIDMAASQEDRGWNRVYKFKHEKLPIDLSEQILSLIPLSSKLELNVNRVSLFVSQPGLYYRPHKDGLSIRFGINYPVIIRDNLCITSWYDDSIADNKLIDTMGGTSREVEGFEEDQAIPVMSVSHSPGNPVLFNTDIFHNWDNTQSPNIRVILTLRSTNPNITFADAKRILTEK